MNYLIKYETGVGVYKIDDGFGCWKNGSKFSSKPDNLEDAKNIIQERYQEDKRREYKRLAQRMEEIESMPGLVTETRIQID